MSDPGVAEVHELPDRVLGDVLIDDLGAVVVLEADLARETQVGAIEPEELRGGTLDPVRLSIMRLRARSLWRVKVTT
jgi:hypothetical protein